MKRFCSILIIVIFVFALLCSCSSQPSTNQETDITTVRSDIDEQPSSPKTDKGAVNIEEFIERYFFAVQSCDYEVLTYLLADEMIELIEQENASVQEVIEELDDFWILGTQGIESHKTLITKEIIPEDDLQEVEEIQEWGVTAEKIGLIISEVSLNSGKQVWVSHLIYLYDNKWYYAYVTFEDDPSFFSELWG